MIGPVAGTSLPPGLARLAERISQNGHPGLGVGHAHGRQDRAHPLVDRLVPTSVNDLRDAPDTDGDVVVDRVVDARGTSDPATDGHAVDVTV